MRRALTSIAVALGVAGVSIGLGGAAVAGARPVAGGVGGGLAAGGATVFAVADNRLRELTGLVSTETGYVVINDASSLSSRTRVSAARSPGDNAELAIPRYAPAAPSAAASPSVATPQGAGDSSLTSSLTLQDITYLIGVVGLIGAVLVGAGVWGILRARRRPAPAGPGRTGRDEDGPAGRQPVADPMNAERGGYPDPAWHQRPEGYNESYPGGRGIETSGGNRRPAGGAVYGARPAGGGVYGGGSAPAGGGGVYGGGSSSGAVYGGGQDSSGGYRGSGRDDERGGPEHRDAYRGDDQRGRQQRRDDPPGWDRRPAGGRGGTYGPGGAYGPPTSPEGYDDHGYRDEGGYGRR